MHESSITEGNFGNDSWRLCADARAASKRLGCGIPKFSRTRRTKTQTRHRCCRLLGGDKQDDRNDTSPLAATWACWAAHDASWANKRFTLARFLARMAALRRASLSFERAQQGGSSHSFRYSLAAAQPGSTQLVIRQSLACVRAHIFPAADLALSTYDFVCSERGCAEAGGGVVAAAVLSRGSDDPRGSGDGLGGGERSADRGPAAVIS